MLWGTVSGLRETAELLDEAGRRLGGVDPGATAFGVDGPGLLGEVGREAYRCWHAALAARSREAQAHAGRGHDLAQAVATIAGSLAGADSDAQREVR